MEASDAIQTVILMVSNNFICKNEHNNCQPEDTSWFPNMSFALFHITSKKANCIVEELPRIVVLLLCGVQQGTV